MFYHLFHFLSEEGIPGAGLFQYISFRAAMAVITSLVISMIIGKGIIERLRRKQIGESIRDLGLEGQMQKQGTPTMGGLIILASIIIPVLLFARLDNVYVLLLLGSTVWLGAIGFIDDYIKVFKKNKKGLSGKFKIVGQVGLGLIAGSVLYFSDQVIVENKVYSQEITSENLLQEDEPDRVFTWKETRSTKTTIPFIKNNEFDYGWLISWLGEDWKKLHGWSSFLL